jgi:hypothetical protein
LKVCVLLSLSVCSIAAFAASDTPAVADEAIVANYVMAARTQGAVHKGASMDIEIDASLPALKKQGRFHALRRISPLGLITYEKRLFEGDNTVRNQVILRYLNAEAEEQREPQPMLAVTPENYKFKYKGRGELDGRAVHIFDVTPKKKQQGLYKGQLWIDAGTYLRVQEAGYLVKSPSIFLKKVAFVRKYDIRDGLSVPLEVQSVVDTRIAGKAEITIAFSNFSVDDEKRGVAGDIEDQDQ